MSKLGYPLHPHCRCTCSLCRVEFIRSRVLLAFPLFYLPFRFWDVLNVISAIMMVSVVH